MSMMSRSSKSPTPYLRLRPHTSQYAVDSLTNLWTLCDKEKTILDSSGQTNFKGSGEVKRDLFPNRAFRPFFKGMGLLHLLWRWASPPCNTLWLSTVSRRLPYCKISHMSCDNIGLPAIPAPSSTSTPYNCRWSRSQLSPHSRGKKTQPSRTVRWSTRTTRKNAESKHHLSSTGARFCLPMYPPLWKQLLKNETLDCCVPYIMQAVLLHHCLKHFASVSPSRPRKKQVG